MDDTELDRYLGDEALRKELETRARRERAEAMVNLLIAATRFLARLPARLRRLLAGPGNGAESVS